MSVSTIGSTRPEGAATAGIDWASSEHAVAVVDAHGVQLQRAVVTHTAAGLTQLVRLLRRAGVEEIGIERGDGPMVDAVLAADFVVFVIPPNQVRNLRRRYGSAGNKDDHFDAYVLADTVRTDRHRLAPLVPDTPATVTMRMTVRARQDLVAARVAHPTNWAHLALVLPVGHRAIPRHRLADHLGVSHSALWPSAAKVDWLSPARLQAWLHAQRYPNPRRAE